MREIVEAINEKSGRDPLLILNSGSCGQIGERNASPRRGTSRGWCGAREKRNARSRAARARSRGMLNRRGRGRFD